MTKSTFFSGKIIIPAILLAFSITACDSSNSVDSADLSESFDLNQSVAYISTDLSLNSDEIGILTSSLSKFEGDSHEPGFLWQVAANMQANMTAEQKARLLEKISNRPGPGPDVHNGGPAGAPFKGRPGFFARNGEKVSETLQLTEDQVAAIELIRESFRTELRGLAEAVKAGTIERSEAKNQMEALSDEMRAELNAVLTDDQRAIRDTMHAEREAQHEANVAAGREAMITVLGLDASQVEALENLRSTIDEERLEFRELIEGGATREEIQELASAAHAANLAALSGVLDTTQFEIFVIHGAISSRMKRRMGPRNHGMRQN